MSRNLSFYFQNNDIQSATPWYKKNHMIKYTVKYTSRQYNAVGISLAVCFYLRLPLFLCFPSVPSVPCSCLAEGMDSSSMSRSSCSASSLLDLSAALCQ